MFTDNSGIYRSFEAQAQADAAPVAEEPTNRATAIRQGQQAKLQLTPDQILRLQQEKPAISAEEPSIQSAMNASAGSHWLAVVTGKGLLQVSTVTPDRAHTWN